MNKPVRGGAADFRKPCPVCKGKKTLTRPAGEGRTQEVFCPACGGTGKARGGLMTK